MTSECQTCHGTGVVLGEPRGHDEDGCPLFVQWACDCRVQPAKRKPEDYDGDDDADVSPAENAAD